MPRNLTLHHGTTASSDRERLLGQRGIVLWLTGLSGSGKSTIARALEETLFAKGRLVYVLDGDSIRHGLNADLGFSDEDRHENIRRIGEVAALFIDAGVIVVTAFISPFRADRERVRDIVGEERFVEVFVDASVDVCEQRDPKGLYRKARAGEIPDFTGISSPYEPPEHPALVLDTASEGVEECVLRLVHELGRREILSPPPLS